MFIAMYGGCFEFDYDALGAYVAKETCKQKKLKVAERLTNIDCDAIINHYFFQEYEPKTERKVFRKNFD